MLMRDQHGPTSEEALKARCVCVYFNLQQAADKAGESVERACVVLEEIAQDYNHGGGAPADVEEWWKHTRTSREQAARGPIQCLKQILKQSVPELHRFELKMASIDVANRPTDPFAYYGQLLVSLEQGQQDRATQLALKMVSLVHLEGEEGRPQILTSLATFKVAGRALVRCGDLEKGEEMLIRFIQMQRQLLQGNEWLIHCQDKWVLMNDMPQLYLQQGASCIPFPKCEFNCFQNRSTQ